MKTVLPIICFILLVVSGFCFKGIHPPQKKISLIFHHRVGREELVLDNPVKNILGENISVQKFKYYVSNFSVTDDKGTTIVLPLQYFLVDEADPLSKNITLTIPDIAVTGIHFLLGIDSIRNVSGVQTGALDPLKGMFWTWNTGYINAKLEGISESAAVAGHYFTYDIGGYRKGANTARMIDLLLPQTTKPVEEINISADINQWFKSKTELRIAETPLCHSPGALAMRIADNCSNMFSINSVR